MKNTKSLATAALLTALSVVIMLVGSGIGVGTYASPMLAGLCIALLREAFGNRYGLLSWIAVSILSLLLVTDVEESLMFLTICGPYPLVRPALQRLPKFPRILLKFVLFNIILIAVELLVMFVLTSEVMGLGLMIAFCAMFNVVFFLYDLVLGRYRILYEKRLKKLLKL